MDLIQVLEQRKTAVINQAANTLMRAQLPHYGQVSMEQNKEKLQSLYDHMVQCIKDRNLETMIKYAEEMASERFGAGFDLYEVQKEFNVLEEALWFQIIRDCGPSQLARALGIISTVHGVGKDTLARKYVSLASKTKSPSLDLQVLFKGTDDLYIRNRSC
jgi:hypothetical protein